LISQRHTLRRLEQPLKSVKQPEHVHQDTLTSSPDATRRRAQRRSERRVT
jgi:hypothetical protein